MLGEKQSRKPLHKPQKAEIRQENQKKHSIKRSVQKRLFWGVYQNGTLYFLFLA